VSKPPQTRAQKNLRFALRVAGLLARGFAAVFSLVLVVLLAAYFALPKIVDGERAKLMLVDQLQRLLQRPVRIEKVILTPQGVKLTGFRILESTGSGSFIEGDFALITVKVVALFHKRLELSNVRLASPRIHIARDADGRWNFEDLFSSTASAKPVESRPFALPVSLASDQTPIESGRLEIEDGVRGTHHLIERVNLSVQQFDFDEPFSYALSFDNLNTFGERKMRTSVALEGEISLAGFDWSQAFVNALKAQVKLDGRTLQGSVSVSSFTAPLIEADVLAPALGAEDWAWPPRPWRRRPSRSTSRCRRRAGR
jgi:AsmA protein